MVTWVYKVPSLSGAHYFLTIVDNFSRSTWVYLIKHKSDVGENLISFYNMIQTQFGKKIKRIRRDNGGEFASNFMMKFYEENGMVLETSCVHTP